MTRSPITASTPSWKTFLTSYPASLLALGLALLAARALAPVLGGYAAYLAVFPAIGFSAWYCGLGPSIVSAILAALALRYWFGYPVHTLAIVSLRQALSTASFLLATALILLMGEERRRRHLALLAAQEGLEERVRQRTAELDIANQGLRELSVRLMKSQDEERRRIARELHDSVGQSLAALAMNLTAVNGDVERLMQTTKAISESLSLVQEMDQEVRTVSYLLHPPLLDEAGLASALRWYIEGYSERSKIQVALEVGDNFGRLPQELETALFRTVQECLTNIHRHSGSPVARVLLARSAEEIRLQVEDQGAGMPEEKLDELKSAGTPGVGLRGMRERLRQLCGTLEVHSTGKGTTVEAVLPIGQVATSEGYARARSA
jgi:signal transduction histidine kinase